MKTAHHDLIVAGAGSGGFGAALAVARNQVGGKGDRGVRWEERRHDQRWA
jgi:hypothetical protein